MSKPGPPQDKNVKCGDRRGREVWRRDVLVRVLVQNSDSDIPQLSGTDKLLALAPQTFQLAVYDTVW